MLTEAQQEKLNIIKGSMQKVNEATNDLQGLLHKIDHNLITIYILKKLHRKDIIK